MRFVWELGVIMLSSINHVIKLFGLSRVGLCFCNAGRVKDYGETPVKRARLALEGYTWGCPTLPTAADLAGMDDVMVAAEATMSQQAADLASGTHVEYRSREPYLIGGWFRAKILQVASARMVSASTCHARRALLGIVCLVLSLCLRANSVDKVL